MIVYHGSKHRFDRFDYNKIGENGTSEGKGFYFTDSRRIAEGYGENGFLYIIDFNGKKPLHDKELTITRGELQSFLLALDKELDYLSNWGEVDYHGLEVVMKEAIEGELVGCESDVDLISSMAFTSGSVGTVLELCYQLLGYDSIITKAEWGKGQTLYIALTNDIIQIKEVIPL